ncbi:MAG: 2-phospho-L-lactate guanylyltransferase [Natrialbaceae archaeon]
MRVLVPFDARDPNTRLSSLFDPGQRRELAAVLLADVLAAIREAGHEPSVLSTAPVDRDCPVLVDDSPLTDAVNARLVDAELPLAVVMADLGLVTPRSVRRLLDSDSDVVLAPGLGGGTNAIRVDHPDFRVDYHGGSYRKHRRAARECGASTHTVDSFRLAVDVDEPSDLAEVLLHGRGETAEWLREAGIELDTADGRCTVGRADE